MVVVVEENEGKGGDDDNANANKKWQVRGVRTDRTERKMKERGEESDRPLRGRVSVATAAEAAHVRSAAADGLRSKRTGEEEGMKEGMKRK